jgi:hypothetical protein
VGDATEADANTVVSSEEAFTMTNARQRLLDEFVRTGHEADVWRHWPGDSLIESMTCAAQAHRDALLAAVSRHEQTATRQVAMPDVDLVSLTRSRIEPMVQGLFPRSEQSIVMALLERSVVFLTRENIEAVLREQSYLNSAWHLANLYLSSRGAELLGPDATGLLGLSQETTCYVSLEYFRRRERFADYLVHEAAHVFHNWKRERAGLPFTRTREWLLEIAFRQRETFAYACEAYRRIVELAPTRADQAALVDEYATGPMPSDDSVDAEELISVLREAVQARNGWKRILARCAPSKERRP